jgi:hypothetical protein
MKDVITAMRRGTLSRREFTCALSAAGPEPRHDAADRPQRPCRT